MYFTNSFQINPYLGYKQVQNNSRINKGQVKVPVTMHALSARSPSASEIGIIGLSFPCAYRSFGLETWLVPKILGCV